MAVWMVFGALLGPVALILLWVAPPGRCATCQASVRGWTTTCEWCGNKVAVRAGSTPASADLSKVAPMATPAAAAAAASGTDIRRTIESTSDARIRERLTSIGARRGDDGAAPLTAVPDLNDRRILASGIYITGTLSLVTGSRYALEVGGGSLRVLGPVDIDPSTVALTQDLAGMEATGFDERLILTFGGGGRHGMVLVFSALEGASAAGVSAAILSAARSTRVAS
jgi:hypothetical protein